MRVFVNKGRHQSQHSRKGLAALFLLSFTTIGAVGFFGIRTGSAAEQPTPLAIPPASTSVLHVQARRNVLGTTDTAVNVEAWLDRSTNEGKIVESATDGTVRRIVALKGNHVVLYLADRRHAVAWSGFGPTSPHASRIRDELLGLRMGIDQGSVPVLGRNSIGGRTADRVQRSLEGTEVVIDVDRETGLVLREEMRVPNGVSQVRATDYVSIVYLNRAELPTNLFDVELPDGIDREDYTVGNPADPRADIAALTYSVYALSIDGGVVTAAIRALSLMPGQALKDDYSLIYRTSAGEIQVISGLPPEPVGPGRTGRPHRPQTLQAIGRTWEFESADNRFQASADLGDAYVTIHAPSRVAFEHAVVHLARIAR